MGAHSDNTFSVDNTAPTVSITYNEPDPYRDADAITVTATFTEANSISGTPQIAIDYAGVGSDVSATDMTATGDNKVWTYLMDVPAGNDGIATITITGSDAAGNPVGVHTGNTFIVDNTEPDPPVITTNKGNDYSTTDSSITLEGTCPADTFAIYANGSTEGVIYTPGETSWTYDGTLGPGENTFDITAEDAAGNLSDVGSITVGYDLPIGGYIIDNVIPSAQISQSTDGDGIITIRFKIRDASGVMTAPSTRFSTALMVERPGMPLPMATILNL